MKAYSQDLRQKIVEACDKKLGSRQKIADTFGVSRSFVQKLLRRRSTTGSITALPHGGGGKPVLDKDALVLVRQLVKEQPDATLEELCEAVHEQRGIRVSVPTMCTALKRMRLPLKKSRSMRQKGIAPGYSRHDRSSRRKSQPLTPGG
jgi:transposase